MSDLLERARICLWAAMNYEFFPDVPIFQLRAFYSDAYGFSLHFDLLRCPYGCQVGYAIAQGRITKEGLHFVPVGDSAEDYYDDEDYYDEDDYDEDDYDEAPPLD